MPKSVTFSILDPDDWKRFLSHVNMRAGQGPHGDCWEWQGTPRVDGYGQFNVRGKVFTTHRLAFAREYGYEGDVVRHRCDNRICVRPAHLLSGTHQDNVQDRVARGRTRTGHTYGEAHPNHKLTLVQVRQIKAALAFGDTLVQIAKRFGVDHTTISQIRRGHTWKVA